MKNKKTPHLDFYKKAAERKSLQGYSGLCPLFASNAELDHDTFTYFEPTREDYENLFLEHKNRHFWGSDSGYTEYGKLTDLRANIILFIAAINNEI